MSIQYTDPSLAPLLEPDLHLLPASEFRVEELTAAYNQTRVDYLVPMPMNAARLKAYVDVYDVSLQQSFVAMEGDEILGLGMLGVRHGRSWITRLGVLPVRRRRGTGEAIMRGLLEASETLGVEKAILEVIKGNVPAHTLFRKLGFQETRELLVLRRPPNQPTTAQAGEYAWVDQSAALALLEGTAGVGGPALRPAWTHEIESFQNAGDCLGLSVQSDESAGWLVFRRQKFTLSHFIFHTHAGSPAAVAGALLSHLYARFPQMDTYTENLAAADPHLPALLDCGFIEAFRRIEMERPFPPRA